MDPLRLGVNGVTAANIEKIAELFPCVITETGDENGRLKKAVNFDLLRQLLSPDVVEGEEVYAFTWAGKKACIAEAGRPICKTLRPRKEASRNWDTTENLYIEGDNLDVLKLLQESYRDKVAMICIDPPYNTGGGFLYKDNFTGSANGCENGGRFHSGWCSMLYPRLLLARNLLKRSGLIVINIDENEIENLLKLGSEVFGKANELGTIIWDKRNPKGDARGLSCQHEYIVLYAKSREDFLAACDMRRPKKNAPAIMAKAKSLFGKIGDGFSREDADRAFAKWLAARNDFSMGEKAYNRIDAAGEAYQSVSMAWPNKKKAPDDYFIPLVHPVTGKACPVPERGWRNPPATMQKLLAAGLIIFGEDETKQPRRKYPLKDNLTENIPSLLYYGGSDTALLAELGIPFDTPKVTNIVKEHIAAFTNGDDIILDFFSGSATTAHAVMERNAEDGGRRRFIMVQLPEECPPGSAAARAGFRTICEMGAERIRRAGEKILAEHAGKNGIATLDTGFRVLAVFPPSTGGRPQHEQERAMPQDAVLPAAPDMKGLFR